MRFYLRGQRLCHLGNIVGNRSVVICRRVCQALSTIVHCFFEAKVLLMNDLKVFLVPATTAFTLI